MRIWIDLANSPHVLFFKPMIAEFERRGHTVVLTARDFAQTVALASKYDLSAQVIGAHGGAGLVSKSGAILRRARDLARYAREQSVDLAVHHNSYSEAVAARALGIPTVALMDYEHQPANHLSFRLASKVMVPKAIPEAELKKYGVGNKLEPYDGIKEDLYVPAYPADPAIRERLNVAETDVLVLARPAPDMAAYHRFHNAAFDDLLDQLDARDDVVTLVTPRTPLQRQQLEVRAFRHVRLLSDVFDGIALIRAADAVITAGGTMGREAVAAGTPAYSLFQGRQGAVDRYLASTGQYTLLSDGGLDGIELTRKEPGLERDAHGDLLAHVVDAIVAAG